MHEASQRRLKKGKSVEERTFSRRESTACEEDEGRSGSVSWSAEFKMG